MSPDEDTRVPELSVKPPHACVVFGGAGFIGTHLLARLAAQGVDDLVSIDIVEPRAPVGGVRYIQGDVRKPLPADLTANSPEIYDFAAVHRTPGHPDHQYYETNVLGALNISDYARRVDATTIHFTSSIAVYGPDEEHKSELSAPRPLTPYGWSKRIAEETYRNWQAAHAARKLTIVRPAVVFGKGENGNFSRLAAALRRRMFAYPGRRDTVKACGYVEELLRSLEFARGLNQPYTLYNFCYPERYTIQQICEAFREIGDLPSPLGVVPLPLMNIAALPFEALNAFGLSNPVNRKRIRKLVRSTNIEPRFLVESGYVYQTNLHSGLRNWGEQSDFAFV